jgi:hypothetical protein
MVRSPKRRRGIASIVGAIIFLLILMMAIGAQAYISGLQAQSSAIGAQAQQNEGRHLLESLSYVVVGSGPTVTNSGGSEVKLVAMLLKFSNGTVYDLNPGSVPPFAVTYLPASLNIPIQPMVPNGNCGSSSCLRKYQSIVGNITSGNALGLVTGMGNTFWYPNSLINWSQLTGFPGSCPPGQSVIQISTALACAASGGPMTSRVKSDQTLTYSPTGPFGYTPTTLTISISANNVYDFMAFLEVTGIAGATSTNFEIHSLPSGASVLLACGFVVSSTGGCQTGAGTPIFSPQPTNVNPALLEIWGTVSVGGTAGNLQLDFLIPSATSVTLKAGSFMWAQQTQ